MDGFTEVGIGDQAPVCRQHMTTKGDEIAVCCVANERRAVAGSAALVTFDGAASDL